MTAFARAEKKKKPRWQEMFSDVYDEIPEMLQ
jgi:TPP-dependent pyruvate/acetoin dehydrogenase alpha subunit